MRVPALCTLASILAVACAPHESHALAPPTEDQAARAVLFMENVLSPAAFEVWGSAGWVIDAEGEHDLSPQSDAEWDALLVKIDALETLAEGLKGADFAWDPATWSGFCDGVIAAAEVNRRAAEAHDVDALFEAGETLDVACESCHLHFEEGETAGAL